MQFIINPRTLKQIGVQAINFIKGNLNKGVDKDGKAFEPYSTNPFAMPAGAYFALSTKASHKRYSKNNELRWFTKPNGAKWVIVEGGYMALKATRFKVSNSVVNLQVRGSRGGMISGLQIIATTSNSVTIGFNSPELARLASYHCLTGAAKRKVIRNFMGITKEQEAELANYISSDIANNIKIQL